MDPLSVILIIIAIFCLVFAIIALIYMKSSEEQKKEKPCSCLSSDEEVPTEEPVFMTKEEAIAFVREKDAKEKEQNDMWIAKVKALIAEAFADSKKVNGLTSEQIETARMILAKLENDAKAEKEAKVALINEILQKMHDQPYEKLFAKLLADIKAAKDKAEFEAAVMSFEEAVEKISNE